jgi:hypothetical protein
MQNPRQDFESELQEINPQQSALMKTIQQGYRSSILTRIAMEKATAVARRVMETMEA